MPSFPSTHVKWKTTFFMALFSDGVLDVMRNPTLAEKRERLKGFNDSETIETFIDSLDKHTLPDDLTVLTVKRSSHA